MIGDIAELSVAADLTQWGYHVAFPFGTSQDWDLLLMREKDRFERVQIKYATLVNGCIPVRARTHSNTSKQQTHRQYTAGDIDWLAVFEPSRRMCCYIPAWELGDGREILHLRIEKPRNNQSSGIRWASQYQSI